jgi:methanogenic corrinoid protein MtbC1
MRTGLIDHVAEMARIGAQDEAVDVIAQLMAEGFPLEDVILDLMSPIQSEMGSGWESGRYSTADEHRVTSILGAALEIAAVASLPEPPTGRVVVACAEGDWHSLPARMMAHLIRAAGWGAEFMGPSSSADRLDALLSRRHFTAVIVTCTMAPSLGGAARAAEIAHAHGAPVLIGGESVTRYGLAGPLGADASPGDHHGVVRCLEEWESSPRSSFEKATVDLTVDGRGWPDAQPAPPLARLAQRWVALSGGGIGSEEALGYLDLMVGTHAAAFLVGEPRVFHDFVLWLGRVLLARGVPDSAVVTPGEAAALLHAAGAAGPGPQCGAEGS